MLVKNGLPRLDSEHAIWQQEVPQSENGRETEPDDTRRPTCKGIMMRVLILVI